MLMERQRNQAGQAAVLLLVVVVVMGIALVSALVEFGAVTQQRARAQTAADAAALASLDGGAAAASTYARRHGATVVSWSRGPGQYEVTVIVRLGDTTASARATNAP
ncbi:MAG: Flp pilus assembly protein TadG [Ilumatobacter sp.]|jgi:Flp pilus assembly protein TadG